MAETDKYFQWIKGENAPEIEEYDKDITLGNEVYLLFKSGRQVNKKLIDDYIVSIANPDTPFIDPVEFAKSQAIPYDEYTNQTNSTQQLNEEKVNMGKADLIPHPDDIQAVKAFNQKQQTQKQVNENELGYKQTNRPVHQQVQTQKVEVDPLKQLIEKSKKVETEVNLTLNLDLPSKAFFNILRESFEGNEQDIVKYVMELFRGNQFEEKLEEFIRGYLEIEKPPPPPEETEGNLKTPLQKEEKVEEEIKS